MLPATGSQESNLGDPGGCGPLCSPSTRITSVMMIQLRVFRSAFHCGGGSKGKERFSQRIGWKLSSGQGWGGRCITAKGLRSLLSPSPQGLTQEAQKSA